MDITVFTQTPQEGCDEEDRRSVSQQWDLLAPLIAHPWSLPGKDDENTRLARLSPLCARFGVIPVGTLAKEQQKTKRKVKWMGTRRLRAGKGVEK
jgi:hypothetical protein